LQLAPEYPSLKGFAQFSRLQVFAAVCLAVVAALVSFSVPCGLFYVLHHDEPGLPSLSITPPAAPGMSLSLRLRPTTDVPAARPPTRAALPVSFSLRSPTPSPSSPTSSPPVYLQLAPEYPSLKGFAQFSRLQVSNAVRLAVATALVYVSVMCDCELPAPLSLKSHPPGTIVMLSIQLQIVPTALVVVVVHVIVRLM
jgi:uncharacterized protein Usg